MHFTSEYLFINLAGKAKFEHRVMKTHGHNVTLYIKNDFRIVKKKSILKCMKIILFGGRRNTY